MYKNTTKCKEMVRMIKVGIIGATGYAGGELIRLLLQHKEVEIVWYGSKSYIDKKYSDVFGNMVKLVENTCFDDQINTIVEQVDVVFTATPQGYLSSILTKEILQKVKVIDLSADYRIKDSSVYESWYGITHQSKELITRAVYGLCELNRANIINTSLVANPGCYPTCSILTIYPLLKEGVIDANTIIIDAKSGTSGAGRGAKLQNLFCEVNENIKAYGVSTHRHTPEIEEQLSKVADKEVMVNFTPHLVPMNRGILITAYANLVKAVTYDQVKEIYDTYYKEEYFVRVLKEGVPPETKWVEGSNFVDVNFQIDERTNRIVMMGAMDNLVKGAAGQAVQNMNIMFGLPENEGLKIVPMYP